MVSSSAESGKRLYTMEGNVVASDADELSKRRSASAVAKHTRTYTDIHK